jgi:homospermidine synthase
LDAKISFVGRILVLGCGSVAQCTLPLLLRHFEMDFRRITVMDTLDNRETIQSALEAGVTYVQHTVTPTNMAETLAQYLDAGDLLIDVAYNIDCVEIVSWCHDHGVMYINTSVEVWDPYDKMEMNHPTLRTLYVRHMALRRMMARWDEPGATAVVEHGANPGLVSHWTKVALEDIAKTVLAGSVEAEKRAALEHGLAAGAYNLLAHRLGVKVIHISERDTQISDQPKQVGEFVNTWSVEGLYEEGVAPAEMGWGTHERRLPAGAQTHLYGPANQICLSQMGMNTWVRSWVPLGGEIIGAIIRHGEAFTMSDYLTVYDAQGRPIYRPTVHYAYMMCDAAIASLHELRMNAYDLPPKIRIMNDEIIDGRDELGVLLLGHDLNGWWVGSQLDIHEARRLVPGQSATTLQVAASILGVLFWMIKNPRRGLLVPDQLPHRDVLAIANPYLGNCPSVQTDWTPLKNRYDAFAGYGTTPPPAPEDVWQFETFWIR